MRGREKNLVGFENALTRPALLLKREPKLMLLLVPTWLVPLSILFLASGFLVDYSDLLRPGVLEAFFQADSEGFPARILSLGFPYLLPGVLVALLALAVGSFASLCFVGIAAGHWKGVGSREAGLSKAVRFAKKFFFEYLVALAFALAAAFLVSLAVVLLVLGVVAVAQFVFSSAGVLPGLLAAIVLGIPLLAVAGGAALFLSFCFWLLPAVVSLTPARGFDAFKQCLDYSRKKFLQLLAAGVVLVAFNLLFAQLSSVLYEVPLLGFALSQVVVLHFSAWSLMLPAAFFMEYFGEEIKN